MSVFKKLSDAREKFHKLALKKTGHNKFAGYYYFELGDFLIPALSVFKECGLLSVISFGKEVATMKIIDLEKPDQFIVIESPMSSAALKGAHEIQNLGAVETYTRRYLWVAALEIVEHDAIDSSKPIEQKKDAPVISPRDGVEVLQERLPLLRKVYAAVIDRVEANDFIGAADEMYRLTDPDELTFVFNQIRDSKVRNQIRKAHEKAVAQ